MAPLVPTNTGSSSVRATWGKGLGVYSVPPHGQQQGPKNQLETSQVSLTSGQWWNYLLLASLPLHLCFSLLALLVLTFLTRKRKG